MIDRFEDMRTFAAVVENRSFGGAAEQLGVVKSAVSRRIRDLESRLGTRLLHRSTRQVSLTEAGVMFYDRCAVLLAAVLEAEEAASSGTTAISGKLRISGPMSFGIHCLAPAVGELLERHAGLNADLALDDRIVDVIGEGFDVAVRISQLRDSSLIARRIAPIRHAACASPDYLRRFGTPGIPADLKAHKGIVYANAESRAYWNFSSPAGCDSQTPHVPSVLRLNNGDAIREAAIAGYGVAVLPTFIIHRAVKAGDLQVFLTEYEPPPITLCAVYPSARHLPARVRLFIDFMIARFGPTPYWDRDVFGE